MRRTRGCYAFITRCCMRPRCWSADLRRMISGSSRSITRDGRTREYLQRSFQLMSCIFFLSPIRSLDGVEGIGIERSVTFSRSGSSDRRVYFVLVRRRAVSQATPRSTVYVRAQHPLPKPSSARKAAETGKRRTEKGGRRKKKS